MNPVQIAEILQQLRMLPYFPNDEYVLLGLVALVGQMCENEDQVRWLVARMTSGLYAEWPGPREMRACYCSKFKPKDGINACSTVYADGIPSEKQQRPMLERPPVGELPPPIDIDPALLKPEPELSEFAKEYTERVAKFAHKPISSRAITKADLDRCPQWLKNLCGYDG